jgi:anti-anti-sigma factor
VSRAGEPTEAMFDAAPRKPAFDILFSGTRPWWCVVCLVGDHDCGTVGKIDRILVDHLGRYNRLFVDLCEATFIDSAVVHALVRAARQARPRGVEFHVVAPKGTQAHRVLELAGLLTFLGCVPCLPEMKAGTASSPLRGNRSIPASRHGSKEEVSMSLHGEPVEQDEENDSLVEKLKARAAREVVDAPKAADYGTTNANPALDEHAVPLRAGARDEPGPPTGPAGRG